MKRAQLRPGHRVACHMRFAKRPDDTVYLRFVPLLSAASSLDNISESLFHLAELMTRVGEEGQRDRYHDSERAPVNWLSKKCGTVTFNNSSKRIQRIKKPE